MKPAPWLMLMVTLALPHVGHGQVVTFDTVQFNPVNSFLLGLSVFERENGYQVFGLGGDGSGDVQSIRSIQFDTAGGLLEAFEQMDRRYVDLGSFGPVAACATGGYAAGVTSRSLTLAIDSLFLYRYDASGIPVWSQFLASDTTMVIRKCIETANGDFVLVGFHEYPRGAFMFRVSSMGDSIRFINFGEPSFYPMSVVEDLDGNLYMAGYTDTALPQYQFRSYLLKCTPEGEVIWWSSRPRRSGFNGLVHSSEGGVLAFGNTWTQNDQLPGVLLVKYDGAGVEEWLNADIIYSDAELREATFTSGFQLPDNKYVFCGVIRNTQLDLFDKGMLYKFDQNGNELWSRFYSHYSGIPVGYPQVFKDVKPTSDGGFILAGETNGPSPPNPVRLWLVKLDSMGCLVPGCHTVGVEEYESQLQSALQVSPNPANEQVMVELALPEGYRVEGTVQLLLLDAQGKEVSRQTLGSTPGHVRTSVDVGALPAGLYYVHLRDDVKWLAGGKVVVSAP